MQTAFYLSSLIQQNSVENALNVVRHSTLTVVRSRNHD